MRTLLLLTALCLMLPVSAVGAQGHINPIPSDCWFTASVDTPAYNDPALTQLHLGMGGAMTAGLSFQVLEIDAGAALLAIDHAMGFWVDAADGVFSGQCSDFGAYTPTGIPVTGNTRLWSQPDVILGSIVTDLPAGAVVTVIGGPAVGRIRFDTTDTGEWYPVIYGALRGWVWAGRLDFDGTPTPIASAVAEAQTNLWSVPDVGTGSVLRTQPNTAHVDVIGGPVTGPIRFDDDTIGVWYQVRTTDGRIGWIWEGRLTFD